MVGRVAILILAAGEGSRMGSIKQLLAVGDSSLLGTVIQNSLKSTANHIYCVLGAYEEVIRKDIQEFDIDIIMNDHWQEGLGSSIAKGVAYIIKNVPEIDAILIMLGDQPLVEPEYIDHIISSYQKNRDCISASGYEKKLGVPAIFPKSWFSKLMNLKGDQGARLLLNEAPQNIISIEREHVLTDIDTPDDYQRLMSNNQKP